MADVANMYLRGSRLPLLLQPPITGVYGGGDTTGSPLVNTALGGLLVVIFSTMFTLCCTSRDVCGGVVGDAALSALNTDSFCVGGGRNTTSATHCDCYQFLK